MQQSNENQERMLRIVERLFDRLATKYGRAFMAQYEGLNADSVKADWAHELSPYNSRTGSEILKWALENLPERTPNSIQFHNLCRQAPIERHAALPSPEGKPMTEAQKEVLRKATEAFERKPRGIDVSWAHAIMGRIQAGTPPSAAAQRMAREALGVKA